MNATRAWNRYAINTWRARWDLNPGSPAPQASVLIQTRPRALLQRFSLRYRYILRFVGVQLTACIEEWCLGFCDRGVFGREGCAWFLCILWLLSSGG